MYQAWVTDVPPAVMAFTQAIETALHACFASEPVIMRSRLVSDKMSTQAGCLACLVQHHAG
jgi:hypothetical protein